MKYLIHTAFAAITAYIVYRILKDIDEPPEDEYAPADYASALYMDAEGTYDYELPEQNTMPF